MSNIENNEEENKERDLSIDEFNSMMGVEEVEVVEEEESDPYLEDDLRRLNSDDFLIDGDDYSAIIDQYDGIISWRLEGYRDQDTGDIVSAKKMRNDPPTLVVENNNGDVINFKITQELARTLSSSLNDIYETMSGKKRVSHSTDKDIIEWLSKNKIKTGFLLAFIILLIFMIVI